MRAHVAPGIEGAVGHAVEAHTDTLEAREHAIALLTERVLDRNGLARDVVVVLDVVHEQLQRAMQLDKESASFTNPGRYSFFGIGFYSPADKFEKIKFEDVASEPFQKNFSDGWLSMIQHYFFAAWIPPAGETNAYSTQVFTPTGLPRAIARSLSPQVSVASGGVHG